MKKKLLFDLFYSQSLGSVKFHGGGEYIKKVFSVLVERYSEKIEIYVFYNFDKYLDDWIKELIVAQQIKAIDVHSISEVKQIILKYEIDVFYTGLPYEYRKDMFPENIVKIATFHGMRAVECPHDVFEYKYIDRIGGKIKEVIRNALKNTKLGYAHNVETGINNYNKCIEAFDRIMCVSEHTKYSLLNYLPERKLNVDVLYSPLKVSFAKDKETCLNRDYGEYILILGANRWVKNSYRGIRAIDDMYSRKHLNGIKTVIVGGISKTIYNEIHNKDRFVFLNYVAAEELEELYKNCKIFLYPTLNEGFGYPPLEAMAYGKTCIVSSVCSLPEICGNAVYYVNPFDVGEIQNRIIHGLSQPISPDIVYERYNSVYKRQERDLYKLCDLIAEG